MLRIILIIIGILFLLVVVFFILFLKAMPAPRLNENEIVKAGVFIDPHKRIYVDGKEIGVLQTEIDADSFEALNLSYAKDKRQVIYFHPCKFENAILYRFDMADPNSFEPVGKMNGKDKNHVYIRDRIIEDADPATFESLDHGYARDKHNVFTEFGQKTKLDRNTVKIISDYYQIDSKGVHYGGGDVIVGADAKTFKVIKDEIYPYAKDSKVVYCGKTVLKDADPAFFKLMHDSRGGYFINTGKDKRNVYFLERKIINADAESFRLLENNYARDETHIYYSGKLIEGADADTFKIANDIIYNSSIHDSHDIAYDKNYIFYYSPFDHGKRNEISEDRNYVIINGEIKKRNKWWQFWKSGP